MTALDTGLTAEPVARPLVGYRDWVADAQGRLLSLSEAFNAGSSQNPAAELRGAWFRPGRSATSFCVRAGHAGLCNDAFTCTCGLHAYAEPHHWAGSGLVHGAIVAWGRIVLHSGGFRAEHARPIAFVGQHSASRKRAVERYGLPRLAPDELTAYAEWHGDALI